MLTIGHLCACLIPCYLVAMLAANHMIEAYVYPCSNLMLPRK